jgi:hypothetical protein
MSEHKEETRTVQVRCNGIELKMTLTPKFLNMPFDEAVVEPFVRAYNSLLKKKDAEQAQIKAASL